MSSFLSRGCVCRNVPDAIAHRAPTTGKKVRADRQGHYCRYCVRDSRQAFNLSARERGQVRHPSQATSEAVARASQTPPSTGTSRTWTLCWRAISCARDLLSHCLAVADVLNVEHSRRRLLARTTAAGSFPQRLLLLELGHPPCSQLF